MMAQKSASSSTALSLDHQEEKTKNLLGEVQEETKSSIYSVTGDDEFLDEENDFFWILQNVFWNAVKSLFILFVLGAIIWVVWRPGKDDTPKTTILSNNKVQEPEKVQNRTPQNLTDEKPSVTAEVPAVVPALSPARNTSSQIQPSQASSSLLHISKEVVAWHNYLEQKRVYGSQSSLYEGSWWLKQVESLYDVPVKSYIDGNSSQLRQQNIQNFLGHIAQLLQKSYQVRSLLYQDLQMHNLRATQAQQLFTQYNTALTNAYNAKQTANLPALIEGKGQASKDFTINQAESDVRRLLIQQMEQYDKALRGLYDVLFANQAAIAQDIRVVNFPSDPFGRVLTPAEWRNGGQ